MTINVLYTDITPELNADWSKDLSVARGARAVRNSIIGIITTRKGSRPFDPRFGCNLNDELFENLDPLIKDTIETSIFESIRTYEPRIKALYVKVDPLYDLNAIIVTVQFSIVDNPEEIEQLKLRIGET